MSEHHGGNGELIAVGALAVCCVLPALVVLAGALRVGVVLGPPALGAGATGAGNPPW